MNILLINAHPDFTNPARSANQLTAYALDQIAQLAPTANVEQLTLYAPEAKVPALNADAINHPEQAAAVQDRLIDQWKGADLVLILMPLHNFNVVSKLKDYIDNLLIAGKTFKYTADGSVGLLDPNQKVAYIQTSGSDYSQDIRYVNADIAPYYMRTFLSFMGINNMTLIRAQGLDLVGNDKAQIVADAKIELNAYLTGVLGK